MDDPHVVALHYRTEVIEGFSYTNPPAVAVYTAEFDGTLDAGHFVANMLQHYQTGEDAKLIVDVYLRAWEISAGLCNGRTVLRFKFDHVDIIDRTPPKPGEMRAYVNGVSAITCVGTMTAHMAYLAYPAPPINFAADPLVETLWQRYEGHIAGKEPMFAMAYFCLTAIESSTGSGGAQRKRASMKFNIDSDVLNKIGELASSRGDARDARKATDASTPATSNEITWLLTATRTLITQAAALAAGKAPARLGMSDLPPL